MKTNAVFTIVFAIYTFQFSSEIAAKDSYRSSSQVKKIKTAGYSLERTPGTFFYLDADGDGYGNPNVDTVTISAPPGYVSNNQDCNDANATIHPSAREICNGIDDDCSGIADDNVSSSASIDWQHTYGGAGTDELYGLDKTMDGGYILAGETFSNNGDVTNHYSKSDVWIVKVDGNGNLQWQKDFGGSQIESANAIRQMSDSGYIVACSSMSTNNDVTGNHGGSDFWIIRLDKNGSLVWQKSYGGSGDEVCYAIDLTSDGGCVATGYTRSNNDGNVTGGHTSGDYWIVKLDANGNMMWQKAYGGSAYDFAHTVVQAIDGGYVVSGYARSTDGDVIGNHGQEDVWIVKLDASGNMRWQKSYGGTGGEGASSLRRTADGGYVMNGVTHSYNIDVVGNHGLHDFWVLKIDSVGNLQWKKCLGGTDTDDGNDIIQTSDGGYLAVGLSDSPDDDVTNNHGFHDYWVVKLNSAGSIEWQKTLGGSQDDEAYSVVETSNGEYVVGGYSKSNDDDVSNGHDSSDFWVVKIIPPLTKMFYFDADGDGYGNPNSFVTSCFAPNGYVANSSDCNDSDSNLNPGVYDICNGLDDNCNGYTDENSFVATVSPLTTLTICNTSSLTYTCNTFPGVSYQWQKNGINISGATNTSYTATAAGNYSVVITSGTCVSNSAASILKTTAQSAAVSPSGTTSVCPGNNSMFSVTAKPGLMYQWKNSSGVIAGATTANFSASTPGSYFVTESDITGCSFNSSTSTLQNYAAPVTNIKVTGNLNICATGSVILSVLQATGSVYQWYKDNAAIAGATINAYTATVPGFYKALITTVNGCTGFSPIKTVKGCRLDGSDSYSSTEETIKTYPNPSTGKFTYAIQIDNSFSGDGVLRIFNTVGQMVMENSIHITDGTLTNVVTLPDDIKPGLYFLKLFLPEHEITTSIIISK